MACWYTHALNLQYQTNKQERLKCLKWQIHCAGTTRVEVTGRTAWKGDSSSGYSRQTAMERRWHDATDCSRHGQQRPETLGRRPSTTVYGEWTVTMPNEVVSGGKVRRYHVQKTYSGKEGLKYWILNRYSKNKNSSIKEFSLCEYK